MEKSRKKPMTDATMIDYILARGWQPAGGDLFTLAGRTGNAVDLPLAFCIQRHLERVHEKTKHLQTEAA